MLAIQLLVVLAGAEVTARAVAKLRLGIGAASMAALKAEFQRTVPRPAVEAEEVPAAEPFPLNYRRALHPYFGFTYERTPYTHNINNQGFLSSVDFPYQPAARELVVGIFGGSVAQDLRLPGPERALREGLAAAFVPKGYDRVTLLMMAQSGWKQPQSLFAFLYSLDGLDLALFLEGFNEIGMLPLEDGPQARTYPWTFPAQGLYGTLLRRAGSREAILRQREAELIREKQLRYTKIASGALLGRSMMVHLLWRAGIARLEAQIAALDVPTQESPGVAIPRLVPEGVSLDAMRSAFFDQYESWILAAHHGGLATRHPLFHFVQPSQYVEGSKPLAGAEREVVLARDDLRKRVPIYYPSLRRMSSRLRERGVASFDLSMIFEHVPETTYTDSCCHMNEHGMTLVARAMVDAVRTSPLVEVVPAAPERVLPFGPRPEGVRPRSSAAEERPVRPKGRTLAFGGKKKE